MIIALGGRMGSGKSVLSSELIKSGFIKISFADALKNILSQTFSIEIDKFYSTDEKSKIFNIPICINKISIEKICNFYNINPEDILSQISSDKYIYSLRDLMQYVGTDILRKYDYNIHITKTIESIDLSKNYVCDDVRYLNELNCLKQMGAIDYYVIRQNNFNISNHISEVSLNWTMFSNVIINNKSEKHIKKIFLNSINYIDKWNNLTVKGRTNQIKFNRSSLLNFLQENNFDTTKVSKILNCSRDKIVWWCNNFMISIDDNNFYYDKHSFLHSSKEASYYAGLLSADGCIKKSGKSINCYAVELSSNDYSLVYGFKKYVKSNKPIYEKIHKINKKNNYYFIINSPYIVENLKFWNLKPRKSKYNEIPDIIKYDKKMMSYWFLGLIDGDGTVLVRKPPKKYINKKITQGDLIIQVLASKEVIYYLHSMFPGGSIQKEKRVDNLYYLSYFGSNAIFLYKEIYDPIALSRKWDKIEQFIK